MTFKIKGLKLEVF